mmetsp:Transcript_61120/g.113433  ORF Transcript_61120/g.113433 Transcript_61120/m.113433 type:complete len:399 (-) Transcript_61120:92-1288(-)
MSTQWKEITVDGKVKFKVPVELEFIKKVGSGAYGTVASFQTKSGQKLAVKKVSDAFHDLIDGKRILREVKLLRSFNHDNIISILDMYPPDSPDFDDIYIVTDLMETDLHRVIYSKQQLNDEHHQYFTYQTLRGLLYLHSANVVHRDLKPSNILVNKNCDLKICDFGLARGVFNEEVFQNSPMTEYVCTRWYRATEVLCSWPDYDKASDIWSIGCIFAEMIRRKPLFPGRSTQQQLQLIVTHLGSPTKSFLARIPNIKCRKFLMDQPGRILHPLHQVVPTTTREALDILHSMLAFDPDDRLTATDLLEQPYLALLHNPDDEPVREPLDCADFEFERRRINMYAMRQEILAEALQYHPEKRAVHFADSRNAYSIYTFPMLQRGETHHSDDDETGSAITSH